jgi:hypothetical protein
MADLSEEELAISSCWLAGTPETPKDIDRMAAEIRRHRAAIRADRERVRSVTEMIVAHELGPNSPLHRSGEGTIHAISDRVADALATPAQAGADDRKPTLAERREALGFREPSADERRAALESILDTSTSLATPAPALTAERVRSVVREAALRHLSTASDGTANAIADRAAERLCGAVPVCPSCHNEIDPDCCHCGVELARHRGEEHGFVPMGCDCGREPDAGAASPSEAARSDARVRFELAGEDFVLSTEAARRLRDSINEQLGEP